MALLDVQHKSAVRGSAVPAAIVLSGTPSTGNLILLFLHVNITTSSITVDTTKWTVGATVLGGAGNNTTYGQLLYRYVQGGDTATLPAQWTAGTTYSAYEVYEISGVSGTFATDVPLIATASNLTVTNLTSLQPAALTTTVANALAIMGGGRYNGSTNPTIDQSYAADETSNNAGNYGSQASGSKAIVSSGTSNGQPTITYGVSGAGPCDAISVIVQIASTNYNADISGVSATGTAHAVSGSNTIAGASATGTKHAVVPSVAVTAGAVHATGTAEAVAAGRAPPAGAISATGTPHALTPSLSISLTGVSATGTARASGPLPEPHILTGVHAFGSAKGISLRILSRDSFPAITIMRNRALAAAGAMANAGVALIGQMTASGPQPKSVAQNITGVSAQGRVIHVSYSRNVYVYPVRAFATGTPGAVVVSVT